jgi:hypothetical protein
MEFVGSGANQTFSATFNAGATLEAGPGFTLFGSVPANIIVRVVSGGIIRGGTFVAGERAAYARATVRCSVTGALA